MSSIYDFLNTEASSSTTGGVNAAEGQDPSTVNDGVRQLKQILAAFTDDRGAVNTVGGTADAITVTLGLVGGSNSITAYATGQSFRFKAGSDNTGAATMNVNGIGAKAIRKISGGTDVALAAGDILAGKRYLALYDAAANTAAGAWIIDPGAASIAFATNAQAVTGTSTVLSVNPANLGSLLNAGTDNTGGATITMGDGGYFNLITSTTTITAFAFTNDAAGRTARVRFNTARTITHNATSLILPGGANITTAAGDIAQIRSLGSGNFVMEWFTRAAVAPVGQVVAWATFQGDGTVTILASGNVSSITDNGAGDYTFNFSTAIADANYALFGMTLSAGINANAQGIVNIASSANDPGAASTKTTTACRVLVANASTGTLTDKRVVCVVFIR